MPRPLPSDPPLPITLGRFRFTMPHERGWITATPCLTAPFCEGIFKAMRGDPLVVAGEHWRHVEPERLHDSELLVAELRTVQPFPTDEAFLERGREEFLGEAREWEDAHFALKSVDLWRKLGARCLRVVTVSFDGEPARSSSDRALLRNTVSFFCIHPREPSAGIMLRVLQLCDEARDDPAALGEQADALAETLEFLESP